MYVRVLLRKIYKYHRLTANIRCEQALGLWHISIMDVKFTQILSVTIWGKRCNLKKMKTSHIRRTLCEIFRLAFKDNLWGI